MAAQTTGNKPASRKGHWLASSCWLILLFASLASAQTMTTMKNIEYASAGERKLLLDLYLPGDPPTPKLVVWLHGGAWRAGSKEAPQIMGIVNEGFALASIGFRNSTEAVFPAQMHDIKAAIRYLRANAGKYGYDGTNIAIWGYSSGAHLAVLTGTTNGNSQLEGELGNYPDTSSDVQAIVDFSGPTNFSTILYQSTPHGVSVREPALELLLGKPIDDPSVEDLARLASPVMQVSSGAPPLLIMHGMQDNQVPINQSLELEYAYRANNLPVQVQWILQGQHTSGEYFHAPYIQQVAEFKAPPVS